MILCVAVACLAADHATTGRQITAGRHTTDLIAPTYFLNTDHSGTNHPTADDLATDQLGPNNPTPDKIENQIDSLTRTVLADPGNLDARQQLNQLRRQQQTRNQQAFDTLARGLHIYRMAGADAAGIWLETARANSYARALMASSSICLDDIIQERSTLADYPFCPHCGDTTRENCVACAGTGQRECPLCGGSGIRRHSPSADPNSVCPRCEHSGSIPCASCRGYGILRCRRCDNQHRSQVSRRELDEETTAELNRIAELARYLRDGGIDLYTNQALSMTPAISEPPPLPTSRLPANQHLPTPSDSIPPDPQ